MPETPARRVFLLLGLTAVFVGYFAVWLPHSAAGLSFIGLEMGEQAKFLPQVRSGEILPGRSLFYLPPITLALALIFLSASWTNRGWQTWVFRGLGAGISLLAFPAIEALGAETAEWLWRILMIAFVFLAFVVSSLFHWPRGKTMWLSLVLAALAGGILPAWVFLEVRQAFGALLPQTPGFGLGFLLNLAGHFLVALVSILELLPAGGK